MISHLGRYEIVGELGRGSMGVVYKAKDPLIGRFVAIKVANLKGLSSAEIEEYESRFYQEAQAAGRLNHNHIFTIYDMGKSGDIAYIAMEILEGRELQEIIEGKQNLSIEEILNISIQVANALGYAHQQGVVHRDIKPENIMVLNNNQVKIADFGIAKMTASLLRTQTTKILGSPLYMSPEQIQSNPTDARSDIFSFGIVMYKMLTGQLPFKGDNTLALMFQIVQNDAPPPSVLNSKIPEFLDSIVAKCLAKEPSARYQTAYELEGGLRSCLEMLRGSSESHYRIMANRGLEFAKQLAIPDGIPQSVTVFGSLIAMMAIFIADIVTDATVQMHLLYVFPLILIGFHCANRRLVNALVILAMLLQVITLASYGDTLPLLSKLTLVSLIVPTNIAITLIATAARMNFLEVEHLATFDWMTGLHNRQGFEPLVEMEVRRQKRYGGVFSFAYIDLDDFKQLNDSRGHVIGDEALKLLANVIRENIRQTDLSARLGGDEFAILMPNTFVDDCERLCKQLSVAITDKMKTASFSISASIGHVTFTEPLESVSEVFERADKAMYAAKTSGKGIAVKGI
jgi:diguanylate cyclase (GGDEF)-like protein